MIAASGLLWALTAWLWVGRPSADERLTAARPRVKATPAWGLAHPHAHRLVGMAGAVAVLVLLGGALGLAAAAATAVLLPMWLGRLEPAARRRRREHLERQAPLVAELLAATLASGASVRESVNAVADAVGDPGRAALQPVVAALDLGASAADAWGLAVDERAFAAIAESVVRATATGAPLSSSLVAVADDLRRDQKRVVDIAARSAGVRAVAPLAACFLPAFLLLGVVPVVVSLASAVLAPAPA